MAEELSVPVNVIGKVQDGTLQIRRKAGNQGKQMPIDLPVEELETAWRRAIPCLMDA